MAKPPKTPRPVKSDVLPARENDPLILTVGMTHERLIGRVVVAWSRLEGVMEDFIWHLLKLEIDLGRIITARLDAVTKIKMLRDIGQLELTEDRFHKLSPILDRVDILRDDRNLIMHGTWGRNRDWVPIAISLRPKPLAPDQVVSESFPDKRMRNIAHDIVAAKFQLMRLMKEIGALTDISIPQRPEG